MAAIHLEKHHRLGWDEAHRRLQKLEPELAHKYGVRLDWKDHQAEVRGSGISGSIFVEEQRVAIDLKLGLKLTPFQGKIRTAIDQQVARALA